MQRTGVTRASVRSGDSGSLRGARTRDVRSPARQRAAQDPSDTVMAKGIAGRHRRTFAASWWVCINPQLMRGLGRHVSRPDPDSVLNDRAHARLRNCDPSGVARD